MDIDKLGQQISEHHRKVYLKQIEDGKSELENNKKILKLVVVSIWLIVIAVVLNIISLCLQQNSSWFSWTSFLILILGLISDIVSIRSIKSQIRDNELKIDDLKKQLKMNK